MERCVHEVGRLNAQYVKLACQGWKLLDIYRQLVKQEHYALLSQYTYELNPTSLSALRSKRVAGSPIRTDVSAQKGM